MKKFIFLTSSSYSGSTLLAFILGSHPSIATISELDNILDMGNQENYICSCRKNISNCHFWNQVTAQMHKTYKDFSFVNFKTRFEPKSNSFIDRLQFARIVNMNISNIRDSIYNMIPKYNDYIYTKAKRNIYLAKIILDITNKDIFFDASKTPNRIKFLKRHLDCEFKVIHLVKDGRGVFDSHKRNRRGISDEGAISAWKKANLLAEKELKSLEKGNKYLLRYKDLVTDPVSEIRRLSDFIGVEYDSQCLDFRNSDHHIIGNTKMRLGTRTEIFYDEKWKQSLSPVQLNLFERLAGDMNRKYGYF